MHYHIILTEKCNSKCKYCYEKSLKEFSNSLEDKWDFEFDVPVSLETSEDFREKIREFLKKDSNPVVIFYGGEPLLEIEKIKYLIDNLKDIENIKFRIQTNGKLLDNLSKDYLNKIGKVLVSIDGDKKRTDLNKGQGTYEKIIENIKKIRNQGYTGEVIARMTIATGFPVKASDIFEQVKHLMGLINQGIFDSLHWQLDAEFYENDFSYEDFKKFVKDYNVSLKKLVDYWIEELKKGNFIRIYPFIGIINRLRGRDKETRLQCGAGFANYTITTNGKITACPIMNNIKNFYCGSLENTKNPKELKKISLISPCNQENCSYKKICGGRCLYSNHGKLWPKEGHELVCKTIKHLIDSLNEKIPEINDLIEKGIINEEQFDYEKYFGPEIIP